MSEEDPDKMLPLSRWVKAKVVSDEPDPAEPTAEPAAGDGAPADAEPDARPPVPPITDEELRAARWFSIAFLVVVIPLGLVVLTLVVWAFVSNIPWQ